MSVIKIRVDDQQIALTNMPVIASGGIEENQIEFDFSSDWAGFACVAVFYRENKSYESLISATGIANVPNEVVATDGKMWLGVMGVRNGVTKTSELVFYKILQGAITQEFDPGEPTPDIYNQILDYVSGVVDLEQRLIVVENKSSKNADDIVTQTGRIDNMIDSQQNASVTTLWTGDIDKVNQTATLSESIANYDFIDVYCGGSDNVFSRKPVSNSIHFEIETQNMSDDASSQFMRWWETGLTISGTTATITKAVKCYWDDFSSVPVVSQATDGGIDIVRIDGVKIGHVENDEIVDARVGANGVEYSNLGNAIRTQFTDVKSEIEPLYYKKTLSGNNSYCYFPCELNVGDVYTLKNNTSGTGTVATTDSNNTWVETISANINPGETITFSPTLPASKLRIWFNTSGTYTLINTSKRVPVLEVKVSDLEQNVSAIESKITDINNREMVMPVNLMSSYSYRDHMTVDNTTGNEVESENYATFGSYELYGVEKIYITRQATSTTRTKENAVFAFYDENNTFISRSSLTNNAVSVPINAKFVKFVIQRDYAVGTYYLMLEHGDGATIATAYSTFFTPYGIANPLMGKKICSFGDSLAAGDNGDRTASTWLTLVANLFNAIPYNRGIGSSCVTDETSAGVARVGYSYVDSDGDAGEIRSVYSTQRTFADYPTEISPWMCDPDRANTIPTDTDVVVIMAGTNDIGTVTLDGFKTAYRTMLNNIIARVPNAKIYPCTMPFQQTYDLGTDADKAVYNSYRTAIKEISAEYGFECIDLRAEMGVNAQNYSTYMSDVTHYATVAGKRRMAECVCSHLKSTVFI